MVGFPVVPQEGCRSSGVRGHRSVGEDKEDSRTRIGGGRSGPVEVVDV